MSKARIVLFPWCCLVGHEWQRCAQQLFPKWADRWLKYWRCARCGVSSEELTPEVW